MSHLKVSCIQYSRVVTGTNDGFSCALQSVCRRRLELALLSTRQPHTPLKVAKPLSLILNADNTLSISSSKLSKTMKTIHIPVASGSIILLVLTAFRSPSNAVCSIISLLGFWSLTFSSYFPFSWRHLQCLFGFRRERKGMEVINKDGEAMHIIKEWNMVLSFLEYWLSVVSVSVASCIGIWENIFKKGQSIVQQCVSCWWKRKWMRNSPANFKVSCR